MRLAHIGGSREIGDGACDAQDPVVAPGREAEAFGNPRQKLPPVAVGARDLFQDPALGIGVHAHVRMVGEARGLHRPRGGHPLGHRGRAFARLGQVEIGIGHRRHLDPEVEAVHQRPRDAAQVVLAAERNAWRRRARGRRDSRICRGSRRRREGSGTDSGYGHWRGRRRPRRSRSAGAGFPARCGGTRGIRRGRGRRCGPG
jgi:hypothetical protein